MSSRNKRNVGFAAWRRKRKSGEYRIPNVAPIVARYGFGDQAHAGLGREPIKPEALADVRFGSHNGLKLDIAPCPESANSGPSTRRKGCELTCRRKQPRAPLPYSSSCRNTDRNALSGKAQGWSSRRMDSIARGEQPYGRGALP
jgi:hypothetical protein